MGSRGDRYVHGMHLMKSQTPRVLDGIASDNETGQKTRNLEITPETRPANNSIVTQNEPTYVPFIAL